MSKSQTTSKSQKVFWGLNLKNLTAEDKIYAKPGTLLEYLSWHGLRTRTSPISFIGKGNFVVPEKGDVMMVVTSPILVKYERNSQNLKDVLKITTQLLWKEQIIFAEWDYNKHGFMTFFNLKHSPETDDE